MAQNSPKSAQLKRFDSTPSPDRSVRKALLHQDLIAAHQSPSSAACRSTSRKLSGHAALCAGPVCQRRRSSSSALRSVFLVRVTHVCTSSSATHLSRSGLDLPENGIDLPTTSSSSCSSRANSDRWQPLLETTQRSGCAGDRYFAAQFSSTTAAALATPSRSQHT